MRLKWSAFSVSLHSVSLESRVMLFFLLADLFTSSTLALMRMSPARPTVRVLSFEQVALTARRGECLMLPPLSDS